MKLVKSTYLAAALGLLVGAVAFHAPSLKAQAGVKVPIEVVRSHHCTSGRAPNRRVFVRKQYKWDGE